MKSLQTPGFDSRDSFYKTPFGAVPAGTAVTFRLRLPRGASGAQGLFTPIQGGPPWALVDLIATEEDGGGLLFQGSLTPAEPQVLLYTFRYQLDGTRYHLSRISEGSRSVEGQGLPWQLTVYAPGFDTPQRLKGAVFYQIFPDRFAKSGTPKEGVPADRLMHQGWDEEPASRPDPDGEFRSNDYFGGDLEGIRQKLPHLEALGVEGVYLNPIFEAHSNHRYNTADYREVDPLLGTNQDFSRLCKEGREKGLGFVLDGVFSHTGSDSRYFNRGGRYGSGGAWQDPASPYHSWYRWTGDAAKPYESWWGFHTLPNVDEDDPGYRDFICGPQGVAAQWLEAGAAGFRLDVADELPDDFIRDLRHRVKAVGDDRILLGEVWENATTKFAYGRHRSYLLGEGLDTVMNYPWRTAILDFISLGRGAALEEAILSLWEQYPRPAAELLLNLLSSHDVPRAITALGGPPLAGDRDWQRERNALTPEQYQRGRRGLMLASLIQFGLPGCPCLYYGDEAGLYGYADPFNRGTYPWGREDAQLLSFFRQLGPLRRDSQVLRRGDFTPVRFDTRWCVFFRTLGEESILVAVYRGPEYGEIPWDPMVLQHGRVLLSVGERAGIRGLYPGSGVMMAFPKGMSLSSFSED